MTNTTEVAVTTQVYRVYIKATPEAVWAAITQPEWTAKYGYGGRGEYDLRPGGAYRGYSTPDMRTQGAHEVAVEGEVIESDPPRRLVMTWRMVIDEAMAAEGFSRLTYEIDDSIHGTTRLTVIHDLENTPMLALLMSGGMEAGGAGGGWSWILSGLKTLLETGSPMATHTGELA